MREGETMRAAGETKPAQTRSWYEERDVRDGKPQGRAGVLYRTATRLLVLSGLRLVPPTQVRTDAGSGHIAHGAKPKWSSARRGEAQELPAQD